MWIKSNIMHIEIRTSDNLRYASAGDYFEEDGKIVIVVFDQGNDDHNLLIALHELLEQALCRKRGITNEQIDAFDFSYEEHRHPDDDTSEPGDDPACPYRREHRFAMIVEQMMALELGVDWNEYDKNIKVYEPVSEK